MILHTKNGCFVLFFDYNLDPRGNVTVGQRYSMNAENMPLVC